MTRQGVVVTWTRLLMAAAGHDDAPFVLALVDAEGTRLLARLEDGPVEVGMRVRLKWDESLGFERAQP